MSSTAVESPGAVDSVPRSDSGKSPDPIRESSSDSSDSSSDSLDSSSDSSDSSDSSLKAKSFSSKPMVESSGSSDSDEEAITAYQNSKEAKIAKYLRFEAKWDMEKLVDEERKRCPPEVLLAKKKEHYKNDPIGAMLYGLPKYFDFPPYTLKKLFLKNKVEFARGVMCLKKYSEIDDDFSCLYNEDSSDEYRKLSKAKRRKRRSHKADLKEYVKLLLAYEGFYVKGNLCKRLHLSGLVKPYLNWRKVEAAVAFAVAEYNKIKESDVKYGKMLRVNRCMVKGGKLYFMTFKGSDKRYYEAKVHEFQHHREYVMMRDALYFPMVPDIH